MRAKRAGRISNKETSASPGSLSYIRTRLIIDLYHGILQLNWNETRQSNSGREGLSSARFSCY